MFVFPCDGEPKFCCLDKDLPVKSLLDAIVIKRPNGHTFSFIQKSCKVETLDGNPLKFQFVSITVFEKPLFKIDENARPIIWNVPQCQCFF